MPVEAVLLQNRFEVTDDLRGQRMRSHHPGLLQLGLGLAQVSPDAGLAALGQELLLRSGVCRQT